MTKGALAKYGLATRIAGISLLFGLVLAAIYATPPDFFVLHSGWYVTATAGVFALAFVGNFRVLAGHVRRLGADVLALLASLKPSIVVAALATGLSLLANRLNEAKITLLTTPLTYQDLQIAAHDPQGFLDAVKFSPAPAALAGAVVAGLALILSVRWLRRVASIRAIAIRLAPALVSAAFLWATASLYSRKLEASVPTLEIADEAWTPAGLLALSAKLGAVPFLFLTSRYGALDPELLEEPALTGHRDDAARQDRWAHLAPIGPKAELPNVVVVLLESTFDIAKAFDISPALQSPLFPDSGSGQLRGELGVNTVGGGTWISEFEAIAGIPARVFGFAGNYTHVSVAPYVSGTLASYMKQKGYQSLALYPTETRFYKAREAYARYGFDRMLGADDLHIERPWYVKDTEVAQRYADALSQLNADKPYFAFALTIENHAPHPCPRFSSEAEMTYRFADDATPRATCELNEYIARMRSTEAAIQILEAALRERERKTGRPYVLALFGDHQPHTFTSTGKTPFWSAHDYSKSRRSPSDVTLYQIRSTAPSPFADERFDAPIVLLPTLISAYVASDPHDLYLPQNLEIAARCGLSINITSKDSLLWNRMPGHANETPSRARPGGGDDSCTRAVNAALPAYRRLLAIR